MGKALTRSKRVLGALQTCWSIFGITLLVLFTVEVSLRAIFAVRDRLVIEPQPDRRIVAEGYGGKNWPFDHYRELERLEERWEPYVYFRQKPLQGETIAIDKSGHRNTWQAPPTPGVSGASKAVKILMLGGSSLWGFGARDDQTIPSLLAREIHEKGVRAELRNLAEIGHVSTQELIALVRELQGGYRPDIVIFYDGVNDTTSALLEGQAGLTTNEVNRRNEFNLLQSPGRLMSALAAKLVKDSGSNRFAQMVRRRLDGQSAAPPPTPAALKLRELADGVVRHYEANVILVTALAKSFGFRPLFFWQPTVFTKPKLVPVEREEAHRFAWAEPFMNDVYDRVKSSLQLKADPAFHDLATIFDKNAGLVFIDYCHTTEAANAQIASEMAGAVLKRLADPEGDGRKPADVDRGPGSKSVE